MAICFDVQVGDELEVLPLLGERLAGVDGEHFGGWVGTVVLFLRR